MEMLIIGMPMLGVIVSGLFGRKIGYKGGEIITTGCIGLTSIIGIYMMWKTGGEGGESYRGWDWIKTGILEVEMRLRLDMLTLVMIVVVTTVSSVVHVYTIGYMRGDGHKGRFMSYISLFTCFMLILVTGDNLVQLLIGWEGVGLSSYLLINFWYTRMEANKAGIKAMLLNRIGDMGIIIGIILSYKTMKGVDFETINSVSNYYREEKVMGLEVITWIGIMLTIGAVGKSAQIGLHTWLADAMEGPTPVSALIHAATMVTAGVYLIIRSSGLLENTPRVLLLIGIVGTLTALLGGTIGLVQNDIKKVIAYSTCSQLGYMVMSCGLSNYNGGLYHLINHAYFKGLLFLSAGAVIHGVSDEQDMRRMGGLRRRMPITYTMLLIGSISLMGIPYMSGYYSKDGILEWEYGGYKIEGIFGYWLGSITAMLTGIYTMRLIYRTFLKEPQGSSVTYKRQEESGLEMRISLLVLGIGSILLGYMVKEWIIGEGSTYLGNTIYVKGEKERSVEWIREEWKWLPVCLSTLGGIWGLRGWKKVEKRIYRILNKKWYIDEVYNNYIVLPILRMGKRETYELIDKGWLEILGPTGVSKKIRRESEKVSGWTTGWINNYGLGIIGGLIILIGIRIIKWKMLIVIGILI